MNFKNTLFILIFYGLFAWSPIISQEGSGLYIVAFILTLLIPVIFFGDKYNHKILMAVVILILCTQLIIYMKWNSVIVFYGPIWVIISLIVIDYSSQRTLNSFIRISTIWLFILIFGSYFGYIYAILGFEPLGAIVNMDFRENFIFPFTFSNIYEENIIRPSGIYDEAGALSFLICSIVVMRNFYRYCNRTNYLILALGIITASLSHLIFFIFYIMSDKRKNIIIIMIMAFISYIFLYYYDIKYFSSYFDRGVSFFNSINNFDINNILLDNRGKYLDNSINILFSENYSLLFGLDYKCINSATCGGMVETVCCEPLTPLVSAGILGSYIYYISLIILAVSPFYLGRAGFMYFGYALICLQRPNLYQNGYSLLMLLVVYFAIKDMKLKYFKVNKLRFNRLNLNILN